MKKMKFLVSQLYLLMLLALPFVATSCSDDDDPKTEITTLGIEDGATVNVGQIIQLKAQVSNMQGEVSYAWQVNGKEVSTESGYSFVADKKGSYSIVLAAIFPNQTIQKSITINAQMYPSTFYVINEGQKKGSINRYVQGQWSYDITPDLGMTTTVGIMDGDMYIVSKSSPFLVKMKLSDYTITGSITTGLGNDGQGHNFCIVNNNTGILTTRSGAFKVDLNSFALGAKLENNEVSSDIIKAGNYIFILCQNTIKVYNASDLSYKKDFTNTVNTGFAQTKDGALWAANENKLVKINVETLKSEEFELPSELKVYYNQWAYTPTCLNASTTENALYFAHLSANAGKDIYKYNTEQKTATKFFSAPAPDKSVYGAGIQVDPRNGDVYIIYTEDGWGEHYLNTNIYVADGVTGAQKAIIDYTSTTYWFPSTITFQ